MNNTNTVFNLEELEHIRSLAINGDRVAAVYAVHERIEEDLAKLPVVIAHTKKYNSVGVNPWVAVASTIQFVCQEVELCLKLFSTGIKIERSKGLRTVSTLYDQNKNPGDCLKSFFILIQTGFSSNDVQIPLPSYILHKFSQTIYTFDSIQAIEWLKIGINNMLDTKDENISKDSSLSLSPIVNLPYISVFSGTNVMINLKKDQNSNLLMISMLTLLIKCEANSGIKSKLVNEKKDEIISFIDENTLQSLIKFEDLCATTLKEKKKRIQQKIERRNRIGKIPNVVSSTSISENNENDIVKCSENTSRIQSLQNYLEILIGTEWRQNRSRLVIAVALIIILCLLTRKFFSTLPFGLGGGLRRTSYGAKRSISL